MKKQNSIVKKINSTSGETLIEVLAAIIIVSLSSVIFLSMTASATKINMKSKEADEKFYLAMSKLEVYKADVGTSNEKGKVTCKDGQITVRIESENPVSEPFGVKVYEGNDMKSYIATQSNASESE